MSDIIRIDPLSRPVARHKADKATASSDFHRGRQKRKEKKRKKKNGKRKTENGNTKRKEKRQKRGTRANDPINQTGAPLPTHKPRSQKKKKGQKDEAA